MRTFAQKRNQPEKTVASSLPRPHTTEHRLHHRGDLILQLQRTIGNQAVQRMLQTHAKEFKVGLTGTASPRFGHDFGWIPAAVPAAGATQTKLAINQRGDEYEQEADRVAEQVMRMPEPPLQSAPPCGEAVESASRSDRTKSPSECRLSTLAAETGDRLQCRLLSTKYWLAPGQPLDTGTLAFMEAPLRARLQPVSGAYRHFGRSVCDAPDAAAYTLGQDVVFGREQYAPDTTAGRRLLAHELVHVMQQGSEVWCLTLGSGTPPDNSLIEVPREERSRVLAAIARVQKVAKDPKGYAACHKMFAETCPGGNAASLEHAFDTATLWRFKHGERPGAGAGTRCEGGDCRTVGYTEKGYGGGEISLAYDLLHELGHVCGIAPEPPHYMADKLALYCMGRVEHDESRQLTVGLGRSTEDWAGILSYGWLLREWRSGRLSLHMDVDFNMMGALRTSDPKTAGEIGGVGFDLRLRPFSGEHFGGLSFHAGVVLNTDASTSAPPPPAIRPASAPAPPW